MSLIQTPDRLQLPGALEAQLHDFRRRVWSIKMIEAGCVAVFGLVVPFLAMFAVDRLWNSPVWVRSGLFVLVACGLACVPLAMHRWIWRNRRLEQLARLLSRKHPHVGDQLLGIIELVHDESEQARSRALCEAAIRQVAADAGKRDFSDSVPTPRHRLWSTLAIAPTVVMLALALLYPAATANAWTRLLLPWGNVPRFTFAAIQPVSERLVVPHGEEFRFTATLKADSLSHPRQGTVQLGEQPAVSATLHDGGKYEFDLPPQIAAGRLDISIGDYRQTVDVEPRLRPELTSVSADFTLPDYLGLPGRQNRDVRGGVLSLVNETKVQLTATASRDLTGATVDGVSRPPRGATVTSPEITVKGPQKVEFQWTDDAGLAGKMPFGLSLAGRDDEAPSLIVEDLPRQKVVLDSETLTFKVRARDDFGVKSVGIEWRGVESPVMKSPAEGERLLSAGGHDREFLDVDGTFSAKMLGIEPQQVIVRVYAEDYLPGRGRVYSSPHMFYVLTAEQHSIWITEKMSQWHRQALEVRDRELQLHETNKQIRDMSQDELDQPETRRRIEGQANAERANGRRLSNLTANGEELVKQAMRNPEIGVGHLETWAGMLQILKDISGNRMPSVADLLKQASQSPSLAQNDPPKKSPPMAGQVRATGQGQGDAKPPDEKQKPPPTVPAIVDTESTQQPPSKKTDEQPADEEKPKGQPSLGLVATTLIGKAGKNEACPAGQKVEEAVERQQDLLAEFEKIADELNRVLANLEGSTLLKRLKAAARLQYKIGGRIGDQLKETFGVVPTLVEEKPRKTLDELAVQESKASLDVSYIMDDMQSFFERRHFVKFKTVLEEMRQEDVIGSLRQLGDDIRKENGMSIAQCDFWSDTLDRWAEDMVDPAKGGT